MPNRRSSEIPLAWYVAAVVGICLGLLLSAVTTQGQLVGGEQRIQPRVELGVRLGDADRQFREHPRDSGIGRHLSHEFALESRERRSHAGLKFRDELFAVVHVQNIAQEATKVQHVLPLGALALGYVGGTLDHDAGRYHDSFKFQPDKQAHLLASTILAKAVADGTSVKLGLATCLVAGLAWEWGQSRHGGYASRFDAAFDAVGCSVGAWWGR